MGDNDIRELRRTAPTLDEMEDAELLRMAASGDRRAFEALYDRHHAPLFRTALGMTRRRQVAEEVLQETFLRAYRHLDRVTLTPGRSLRPWLHRILINLVFDRSARKRIQAGPLEGLVGRVAARTISPERRAEQGELARTVADAIAELPDKHRAVVVLFYLQDMDVVEIADTLSVPPGTIKSRLYYARAALRRALAADRRLTGRVPLDEVVRHALT